MDSTTIYNRFQQIHVLLDDGDRQVLNKFDLTSTQYNLLYHLGKYQEGLTITDLSNLLICTRGNATRLVQRLKERNLIQTVRGKKDRRLVHASLTTEGKNLLEVASVAHTDSVNGRFCVLGQENLQLVDEITNKVAQLLEQQLT
ncbi:MAG: hypothetical protein B6242_12645 [Anaerolineaceae bacterium 4572_78]|nr:MAG: hypothetical protein B6242_12645 [Anaerolineaceae bacterium 4572_78]